MLGFLGPFDWKSKRFLDIGCGSGLNSLIAFREGCQEIVSFDFDADSVAATSSLHSSHGSPQHWKVLQGSVLDEPFLRGLGTFDLVYSWGVLHHTGNMWQAIERASNAVAPGGYIFLALYNHADGWGIYPDGRFGPAHLWPPLKKLYCSLPPFLQELLDYSAYAVYILTCLLRLKNPIREIRRYEKEKRGMSLLRDIKDWLGGYPCEFAKVDEVFRFFHARGFRLVNLQCHSGLMNNEYLFQKMPSTHG